jgi:hypothetical protein
MPQKKPLKDFYQSQDLNYSNGFDIHKRRAEQQKPFDVHNLVYYGDQRETHKKHEEAFHDPTLLNRRESIKRLKHQKRKSKGTATAFNNGIPVSEDPTHNPYHKQSLSSTVGPGGGMSKAAVLSRQSARQRTERGGGNNLRQIKEASIETSQR